MVARQSKISFSRGSSRPRDWTQVSHIAGRHFNLGSTREALKYKNTVPQKTSYRDTELQIQVLTSKISRKERKPGWKRRERRQERGAKGVALQTSPATYKYPGIMGLFPGPPEREDWNLALREIRPDQNQNLSSLSPSLHGKLMGKQWKQWETLFSWAPKSLQMVIAAMKLKDIAPWKKSYDQPRRHITLPTKICLVKAMVFPVVNYGCESWTIKKAEPRRTDAFELWCWRGLLRVPWTATRSNQSILKEISPEYSLERLILKLKLQYFGHLMQRTDSLEETKRKQE